jgi:DNA-binding GntR family transcriptional regulator
MVGDVNRRRVLREDVRDILMKRILDGSLAPGDRIVETRVARQFGVSQAPVREALRDLELFGFVACSAFRSATVRRMSVEDHLQLYPIRAVLEGLAARCSATRITDSGIRRLERLSAVILRAAARRDDRTERAADLRFHRTVVACAGNRLLLQWWDRMQLATSSFPSPARALRMRQDSPDRHQALIEALRARDPVRAEFEIRRLVEEPGEWLRDAVTARGASPRYDATPQTDVS